MHADRAARRDLLVALGIDLDHGGLVLGAGETADDPRAEAAHDVVLLERRQSDQHDHAVTEQHAIARRSDAERQRRRGDHVAALEAGGVDPFGHQQRPGGKPQGGGGLVHGNRSVGHGRTCGGRGACPCDGLKQSRAAVLGCRAGRGRFSKATSMSPRPDRRLDRRTLFKAFPFSLGVASGEPAADGFVIWTRLAPEPLAPWGGMTPTPIAVTWEVAADAGMNKVIKSGSAVARLESGHSVHVEIDGLEPARDYFYRFRAGGADSPVGRVKTLPAPGAEVRLLKFAAAGCQSWEGGYYTAWRSVADDALDFVFHYGDYIYEYRAATVDRDNRPLPRVMPANFGSCYTLTDYRRRYALYKSDLDLQAAHASCPFLPSFDDHEVTDNWAADSDPKNTPAQDFLFRRAAAFQAWYEHMPVRRRMVPRGPDVLAHRHFRIGTLADIPVLDTRQYRSHQPCGDGFKANCRAADEAGRTMLGEAQERWLADLLRSATGTWQVLAQQVLFSRLNWRSFSWMQNSEDGLHRMDA